MRHLVNFKLAKIVLQRQKASKDITPQSPLRHKDSMIELFRIELLTALNWAWLQVTEQKRAAKQMDNVV